MIDYSGPEYKDLYQEILIDSTFTYGKFSLIPYPNFKDSQNEGAARQKSDFKPLSWVTNPKSTIMSFGKLN